MPTPCVTVIGGGLAGSEAAWQAAVRGCGVRLFEMRPITSTPAHSTGFLGELVCSNSMKGQDPNTAAGLLKSELDLLGSHLLRLAREHTVPAGAALAVDRDAFAEHVTRSLEAHPLIEIVREEVTSIPESGIVIIATGPLGSPAIERALSEFVGADRLAFFDAAAPIVDEESLGPELFPQSRWGKGEGNDYLNSALDERAYSAFREALVSAERVRKKDFETGDLFEACLPIEELARRGPDALRFGPLRPVGITDPRTGEQPFAVLQLRAENREKTAFNLVGCQTNLTFPEQRRVFSLVPGLENADFLRYGVMHRNTFIDAPQTLGPDLSLRDEPRLFLAGQLTGTEGYVEAIGSGLLAGLNAVSRHSGDEPFILPATTALGSLIRYATDPQTRNYQPMHVNFGLVPPPNPRVSGKRKRYAVYSSRSMADLSAYLDSRAAASPEM